ncbi:MAG TPA: hypothetical protein VHG52_08690, partial [Thermomicrobiales bacterium]|nr:hypothetical protein [Thermomicrobiales bacterium]
FEPQRVIELAARFANERPQDVDVLDLFGVNPFGVDPWSPQGEQVEQSYIARNWAQGSRTHRVPARSAYNNGKKAILHMANGVNSINAAVTLAVHAAYPLGVAQGNGARPLSGPEAIETGTQNAAPCRNSDPNIVTEIMQGVFAGAKVALVDPIGIYIVSFAKNNIRLGNQELPDDWISYQRGVGAAANRTGKNLFQRLVVQAPAGHDKVVGDLVDENDSAIVSGNQIAKHVHVGLYYRTAANTRTVDRILLPEAPKPRACDRTQGSAQLFESGWQEFQQDLASASSGSLLLANSRRD